MLHPYNLYNFEAPFKDYLIAGNAKPISIKNYLSDFRHFSGYFASVLSQTAEGSLNANLKTKSSELSTPALTTQNDTIALITSNLIYKYKGYLESNHVPPKTINRRLSTLRKFCSFCIAQGWMKENMAKRIPNVKVEFSRLIAGNKHISSLPVDVIRQFQSDTDTENSDLEDINEFISIINS